MARQNPRLRPPWPAAALAALLAACAAPEPERVAGPFHFACDDGREVTIRFDLDHGTARLLRPGEPPLVLSAMAATSGYWYSNGTYNWRGQGRQAWLIGPVGGPVPCRRLGA